MNVVFFGSPEFAVSSLNGLVHSNHKILLAVTQPNKPAGRGQRLTPCAVAEFAIENKIPLSQPENIKGNSIFLKQLRDLSPTMIVVVAYGKLIPAEILALPSKGCVNVHASLLPRYRGAAPINWAVINGERMTGVTTMMINERMDEGDILLQCSTEITPEETALTLHDHLAVIGADLLVQTLSRLENEGLKGVPQDHLKATYAPRLKKEDGKIDWNRSAVGIYNRIRGLQPWPKAYTQLPGDNGVLTIFDSAVVEKDTKELPGTITNTQQGLALQTGFGQLYLLEVQQSGKRRMPAVEFAKGAHLKVGDKFI